VRYFILHKITALQQCVFRIHNILKSKRGIHVGSYIPLLILNNSIISPRARYHLLAFLARDVIYTSLANATMSVSVCLSVCPSVCDGSELWSQCMPGTQRLCQPAKLKPSYNPQQTWPPPMEGSSRAMLATARPSCLSVGRFNVLSRSLYF